MKRVLILLTGLFVFSSSFAQGFGIGTNTPKTSAMLDVTASNKGVLVPRISLTSAIDVATILSPDTSLLIYNNVTAGIGSNKVLPGYYYWSGSRWMRIVNATDSIAVSSVDSNPDIDTLSCASSGIVTHNPNTAIPDNNSTGVSDIINLTGISGTICKIEVSVRIDHPFDGDVEISLIAPNLTVIDLSSDNDIFGFNYGSGAFPGPYVYTIFSDDAATSITTGTSPFLGTYRPESALSVFNGLAANGNWTLKVVDDANLDVSTFISWQLNVYTTTSVNWTLVREVPVTATSVSSLIASASYSSDPQTTAGVKTALTVNTSSAGAIGTTITTLPGTTLFRSAASPPAGTGNYWVSTCMQAEQNNLTAGQTYYYQVWRKGLVEAGNENCSLIVTRQAK